MNRGRLEPIAQHHDVQHFDCGEASLGSFLANAALEEHQAGMSHTQVWCDDDGSVIGYYTLVPTSIGRRAHGLPRPARGSRDEVPGYLLAKLAIASPHQKKQYGAQLLVHALEAVVEAADRVGGRVVYVEAGGNDAFRFYERADFTPIEQSYGLWMSIETARLALRA